MVGAKIKQGSGQRGKGERGWGDPGTGALSQGAQCVIQAKELSSLVSQSGPLRQWFAQLPSRVGAVLAPAVRLPWRGLSAADPPYQGRCDAMQFHLRPGDHCSSKQRMSGGQGLGP